jgi:hypothetical protein
MMFRPVIENGRVVRAKGDDSEACDLLECQPNDVAKGIAEANAAIDRGEVTADELERMSYSPPDYPRFTQFIFDACFPNHAKR